VKSETDNLIARYLLGELPEDERDRFEERLFADDLFFREIEAARDQLIEDYLRLALSERERERFETYFLASPSRREQVDNTRALIAVANRQAAGEAPAAASVVRGLRSKSTKLRLWLAAAALVVLAVGVILVIQSIRLQDRVAQLERQRAALEKHEAELRQQLGEQKASAQEMAEQLSGLQDERTRLEQELDAIKQGRVGAAGATVASLILTPVLVRDEGKIPLLKITPNTRRVRIRASFDAPGYEVYKASLETVEGKHVWRGAGLKASETSVTVYIPASQLRTADYLLTLSGATDRRRGEEIGKYYFRVVKE
jgi:anti-sigma factor RsiW